MVDEKTQAVEMTKPKKKKWFEKSGSFLLLIFLIGVYIVFPKVFPTKGNIYILFLIIIDAVYCIFVMCKGFLRLKKEKAENPETPVSWLPLMGEVILALIYPIGFLVASNSLYRFVPEGSLSYERIIIALLVAFVAIGLIKSIVLFRKEKLGSDERFDAGFGIVAEVLFVVSIAIEMI